MKDIMGGGFLKHELILLQEPPSHDESRRETFRFTRHIVFGGLLVKLSTAFSHRRHIVPAHICHFLFFSTRILDPILPFWLLPFLCNSTERFGCSGHG